MSGGTVTQPASGSVAVSIPAGLLHRTGSRKQVSVAGGTVREIINALELDYPGLRFNLCYETGELREYVNIFLEGENIRFLQGIDTAVGPGANLHIIHSIAGG
jgi:molybdopterin synthase sulfur carrier subunit